MKYFLAIIFLILSGLSFNGFNTEKVEKVFKYILGAPVVYPGRAIITLAMIGLFASLSWITISSILLKIKRVDKFKTFMADFVKLNDLSDNIGLLKTVNELDACCVPQNEIAALSYFKTGYRKIFKVLPKKLTSAKHIGLNIVALHLPTSLTLVKIKSIQQSILFINHDTKFQNEIDKIVELDVLPESRYFKDSLSVNVPDSYLDKMVSDLRKWNSKELTIHSPKNFGATGGHSYSDNEHWAFLYLPFQFNAFDYRVIYSEVLQLDPLL